MGYLANFEILLCESPPWSKSVELICPNLSQTIQSILAWTPCSNWAKLGPQLDYDDVTRSEEADASAGFAVSHRLLHE
ncbi:hypothetical protein AOLI_G00138130 [Acnodon oligacanthus]